MTNNKTRTRCAALPGQRAVPVARDCLLGALAVAALAFSGNAAFAFPTSVEKGLKLGAGCVGPVTMLAPKLGNCTIAKSKSRIWCRNGDVFDLDDEKTPVPLARSLCGLSQIP